MRKFYFIIPIIGAIIVAFFVSAAKDDIKIREEQKKEKEAAIQAERAAKVVEDRKIANKAAIEDANRRLDAIKAREAEEKRKAAEEQAAKDSRDLVYRERERQYKRLMELTESRVIANEQLVHVQEYIKLQRIQMGSQSATTSEIIKNKTEYEMALNKMEFIERAINRQRDAERAAARTNN
jgi:phosphate/sulfate permease